MGTELKVGTESKYGALSAERKLGVETSLKIAVLCQSTTTGKARPRPRLPLQLQRLPQMRRATSRGEACGDFERECKEGQMLAVREELSAPNMRP